MTRSSKCSAAEKNFGEAMPERVSTILQAGDNGKVSASERATIEVNGRVLSEMKTCGGCGVAKARDEFSPRNRKGGLRGECRPCARRRLAIWRQRNRSRFLETKAAWQAANVGKRRAHKAIEKALRLGEIVARPCERCGADHGVHAHHDDYSKPLDVMWLCPRHHGERHRELRDQGAAG